METLKAEGKLQPAGSSDDPKELPSPEIGKVETKSESVKSADEESSVSSGENIVRELRKVKKQNLITHCLLTAVIVLTVVWQFSEVTLILKVKDKVSHPFRSISNVIEGMLKKPINNGQDGEERPSEIPKLVESSTLPGLKIPNLPQVELPDFSSYGNAN